MIHKLIEDLKNDHIKWIVNPKEYKSNKSNKLKATWFELQDFVRYSTPFTLIYRHILMPIDELKYKIKRSIGRVKYGVSTQDVWGFHAHIAEVIWKGLCVLQQIKHGYPSTKDPITGEWEYDEKRWDDVLQRMIWGWNILYRCSIDDLMWGGYLTDEQKEDWTKKYPEEFGRLTTRYEEKIAMEAFDLLKDHFWGLWD